MSLMRPEWFFKTQEIFTFELKRLLETKHLYQNVTIFLDIGLFPDAAEAWKAEVAKAKWGIDDNAIAPSSRPTMDLMLLVPDVKLFCGECQRIEAFNSISSQEITGRSTEEPDIIIKRKEAVQVFFLSFLCQSCKQIPEVFLVRRQGLKLTLCGRAPMEVADVPSFIPKSVRQYYSGALIAHQSGQTLAGLFLLRTLIEQWARSKLESPSERADEVMDKYMATLPSDFKSRFRSMRSLYDELSADIHAATGSGELFDKALKEITEHFDARRLFKELQR